MTGAGYRSSVTSTGGVVTFGTDPLALRWTGAYDSLAQLKRDLRGLFI
ncbi:hypothetical protein [Leisingera aquimarina]|nr:hypothetical protein [Leisingera aquimarina]